MGLITKKDEALHDSTTSWKLCKLVLWTLLGVLAVSALAVTHPASAQDNATVNARRQPNSGPLVSTTPAPDVPSTICSNLTWHEVAYLNPGTYGSALLDVAALSPDDVWAVGYHQDPNIYRKSLITHWDGTQWSIVPSPELGLVQHQLHSIDALSANDIWAVGSTLGTPQTLTLHWDGRQWTQVPSPNIDTHYNYLQSVSALAPNDVWAVGYVQTSSQQYDTTLTMHWDGTAWTIVPSPNPGTRSTRLTGVDAVSANDVWAVGSYRSDPPPSASNTLAMHWDGSRWEVVPSPKPMERSGLLAVAAVAPNDVWAVGSTSLNCPYGCDVTGFFLHWDGAAWSIQSEHKIIFRDIVASSFGDIWATGASDPTAPCTPYERQTARWDGTRWVASDYDGYAQVGVSSSSPEDVWVVGGPYVRHYGYKDLAEYTDVQPSSPFYRWVRCLACGEAISGYNDGTFRPGNSITRQQLAKVIYNVASLRSLGCGIGPFYFRDVFYRDSFFGYIQRLAERNIASGYPCGGPGEPCEYPNYPYFRPNANVTRGQAAKIVAGAAGITSTPTNQTFEDVTPGSPFYTWVERLAATGAIGGYDCGGQGEPCTPGNRPYFRPNVEVTRGQASKIVSSAFFPGCTVSATKPDSEAKP